MKQFISFLGIAAAIAVVMAAATPALADCNVSNNKSDDGVIITTCSSSSSNTTTIRTRNRVTTNITNIASADGGTVITGEDAKNITIGGGTATARIRLFQYVGNIFIGSIPPIFPF